MRFGTQVLVLFCGLGIVCGMKRDIELIRKLLFYFDEKPDPEHVKVAPIEGYDELTIKYHQVLLYDAGYISCEAMKTNTGRVIDVWPFELTWAGHEFLEKIRNQFIWEEVLADIKQRGFTSASVDMIKRVANKMIRKRLDD